MRTCTGPCNQGRIQCPTPDACEHSEELGEGAGVILWPLALLLVIAIVATVAAVQ